MIPPENSETFMIKSQSQGRLLTGGWGKEIDSNSWSHSVTCNIERRNKGVTNPKLGSHSRPTKLGEPELCYGITPGVCGFKTDRTSPEFRL